MLENFVFCPLNTYPYELFPICIVLPLSVICIPAESFSVNTPTELLFPTLKIAPEFIVTLSVVVGTTCEALLNIPTPFSPIFIVPPFIVTFLPYIA